MCEELAIDYTLRTYQRDPVTRLAPSDLAMVSPLGTAPVIEVDELALPESGAIVEYLLWLHGGGRLQIAPGEPAYTDYLFWFHFANGTLMPREAALMSSNRLDSTNPQRKFQQDRADRSFGLVEQRLGSHPFLAGETFTAADIMTVFALTTMRIFSGRRLDDYPNIRNYLRNIGGRPAYLATMAKGDPEMPLMLE